MATNNLSNESYKSLELMADTIRALMDEVNALRVEVNELKSLIPVQTITQSDRPLTTNDVPANRNLAVPSGVFRCVQVLIYLRRLELIRLKGNG